jgi:hypothetical protein
VAVRLLAAVPRVLILPWSTVITAGVAAPFDGDGMAATPASPDFNQT